MVKFPGLAWSASDIAYGRLAREFWNVSNGTVTAEYREEAAALVSPRTSPTKVSRRLRTSRACASPC
jgi:hypothetical protein